MEPMESAYSVRQVEPCHVASSRSRLGSGVGPTVPHPLHYHAANGRSFISLIGKTGLAAPSASLGAVQITHQIRRRTRVFSLKTPRVADYCCTLMFPGMLGDRDGMRPDGEGLRAPSPKEGNGDEQWFTWTAMQW